jgi:uncharacterized protein (DUF1330 family)
MKPAFWIARANVIDPIRYSDYVRQAGPASKKFGAEILARGGRYEILEGVEFFNRHVLVRYPSFEAAREFYYSDVYQNAAKIRQAGAGVNEVVIVEGEDLD